MHSAKPRKPGVKAALLVIDVLSVLVTPGVAARSVHRPPLAQRDVQATGTKVAPIAIGQNPAIPASKGNDLQKEQLLVSINNKDPQARLEQTVARSRPLQAADVISSEELQELERGLDWARSCEWAAKASLDLAVALFGSEGDLAVSAKLEPPTWRVAELEASVAERAITNSIPRVPTPEP